MSLNLINTKEQQNTILTQYNFLSYSNNLFMKNKRFVLPKTEFIT